MCNRQLFLGDTSARERKFRGDLPSIDLFDSASSPHTHAVAPNFDFLTHCVDVRTTQSNWSFPRRIPRAEVVIVAVTFWGFRFLPFVLRRRRRRRRWHRCRPLPNSRSDTLHLDGDALQVFWNVATFCSFLSLRADKSENLFVLQSKCSLNFLWQVPQALLQRGEVEHCRPRGARHELVHDLCHTLHRIRVLLDEAQEKVEHVQCVIHLAAEHIFVPGTHKATNSQLVQSVRPSAVLAFDDSGDHH
mmetsp:Transcript_92694/g.250146  ORF Transcript_92694/g.250146 Transcript_92694/m.250146 type:complete len:246 (+) Transcript_92694:532-1269(+)